MDLHHSFDISSCISFLGRIKDHSDSHRLEDNVQIDYEYSVVLWMTEPIGKDSAESDRIDKVISGQQGLNITRHLSGGGC